MARRKVLAPTSGTVWLVRAAIGDRVSDSDEIIVIESMKMEIPVACECDGVIAEILVAKDDVVDENQPVAIIEV